MLRAEQLEVVRTNREGTTVRILHGISFTARPGEITAIVGPSGSGKSTLIRLLNRMSDPTAGTIFLRDRSIAAIDPLELRRRVSMVLQKPFMFDGTVLENLQRPFRYRREVPPDGDSDTLTELMALVRLSPDLLQRDARSLSIGEQQRVNVARALITGPEALLLDEPTSALDRPTADRLGSTLHDICHTRQLTVIMVTHDLRLARRNADHLLYLEKGCILEDGPAAALLTHPRTGELRRFLDDPADEEE
ncbi:ABC transporter ATP-binding protein [Trichlorobacter ammonificans]|uniref:Phosphate import ATP-binding protein PstB 1 n=1 Tax=Trichlorobacter ammonificans TaxID=2916410 RepID=A0ABM9DAX5_9BACT|nr:ATP-binding cassette domain-containing protein [Trichlorobacter ammonificans]CAH2031816.1 Phosphate import ATP-binding protein PstB 1 [Trichlorobacter ammonificans]